MAIINNVQGSPLIGSPIMVTVTPATPEHQQWLFHHISLKVYAVLIDPTTSPAPTPSDITEEDTTEYVEFPFSTPVEKRDGVNIPVQFDISDALIAAISSYEYGVVPPERYPYVKFYLEAWDDYMLSGSSGTTETVRWPALASVWQDGSTEGDPTHTYRTFCYAVQGAFSDYERMTAGSESRATNKMTRKPTTSPEVVFAPSAIVRPAQFDYRLRPDYSYSDQEGSFLPNVFQDMSPINGPKSVVYETDEENLGMQTFDSGLNEFSVWVKKRPANAYEVRFVNGLGCLESIHIQSLVTATVAPETEKNVLNRSETFSKFARMVMTKTNDFETWRMSSGPLDKAWTAWFVHEFMAAETMWINVPAGGEDVWLPCNVSAEKMTIIDEPKQSVMEVQFDLQLDISGSPMSEIAV